MGCAAILIQGLETYEWNADIYGALNSVSKIASVVKKRANVVRIAYLINKTNRDLDAIFAKMHGVIEGKIKLDPNPEPVTEQRAREIVTDLTRLHASIEGLYERLGRAGLSNNSLTAGQLRKLRVHGEHFLDLADWIEASRQTGEISAIFERAARERESGQAYNLEQVM
jgi:hypothetical protein